MTQTTLINDTDREILQSEFDVTEKWWQEARQIAAAMINDKKPELCTVKPWSTLAMGFNLYGDPAQSLDEYLQDNPKLNRLLGMVLGQAMREVLDGEGSVLVKRDGHKPTDDELRDRWLAQHPLVLYGIGEWRAYEDGVWPPINETLVERQLMNVLEDAKPEGIRPSARLLGSVAELARIETFRPADTWDADKDLLVCANGMLHIPTKELRKHDPQAYQTTGVPYAYGPKAGCPAFQDALTRLPYRVTQFLQEFAGYCLTTDTNYEVAVWFYGQPGSGKSTIIEGFNAMLGERAGVLSLKQIARSRFGLSNIEGKTLIYAFESPAIYVETTDVLNALVSGEAVLMERKFRDPVKVIPRAKILWAMNKLPRIGDAGDGLFRRVHVVKFKPLPKQHRDPTLKDQIKEEGAGILNWALTGLDRLRKRGRFLIPPEIRDATDEFQANNDPEAAFVEDRCKVDLLDTSLKTQSSQLYQAYKDWCYDNGHKAKSITSVAQEWQRLGLEKTHITGRAYWVGIEIRNNLP
jgi:P4 family phage/plasmid primase-like protien